MLLLHNRCTDQFKQSYTTLPKVINNRSFFLSRSVEATYVAGVVILDKTLRLATIRLRTEYQSPMPKPSRENCKLIQVSASPGALGLSIFVCVYWGLAKSHMAKPNVEPTTKLVDYVQTMLNEGTRFKQIAESLNIHDPRELKRMMTKALGYKFRVHHHFTTEEMSNTI